jgi:hypothetical protein
MSELYQIRTEGNRYRVVKFNSWWNVIAIYYVFRSNHRWHCDCPRSGIVSCRHRRMVQLFLQEKKVDTGWFYDHTTGIWERPVNDPFREFKRIIEAAKASK